jgi:lysophospholipase L1-like esterase
VSAAPLGVRKRLLFTAIVAAGVGLSIEAMLQAAYWAQSGAFLFQRALAPIYRPDPVRCFALQPNLALEHRTSEFAIHIYTNAQGFRTDAARPDTPLAKPADTTRILFLGPSFTFGWGDEYEDTFVARIGEALRASGRRVEVINAGVPSQGSDQQLCWLRAEGHRYDPDLIVQVDYGQVGGIVPECPAQLACPVIEDGFLYSVPPTFTLRAIATLKNSAIVFYAYQLQRLFSREPRADPNAVGKELRRVEVQAAAEGDPELLAERFRRFTAFVREAVGRDVPVLFVHIPLSYVVHPADLPRWKHLGATDSVSPREEAARRVEALVARGIPIVDATPALRAAGGSERMYYWLDIHLTPAGNAAVTETLLPLVETQLPKP